MFVVFCLFAVAFVGFVVVVVVVVLIVAEVVFLVFVRSFFLLLSFLFCVVVVCSGRTPGKSGCILSLCIWLAPSVIIAVRDLVFNLRVWCLSLIAAQEHSYSNQAFENNIDAVGERLCMQSFRLRRCLQSIK